ncbi:putative integral membrane protein [Aequorivita sublithincola DSM 14238]|uniref:Putative integral membrane protein n=1 Tax=Aequorivita sublithincola (strain DSM 14238 / LMG 21431 / ACAM 643 / 9-3) TaxID=746697 RepID=I3YTR9_AEQSU|nr:putative integral membrane protein [Aequorivita sublithincola DSM 14238]
MAAKPILFLAILYSCFISVLFLLPGQDLPKISLTGLDKIVHSLIYFMLVNLWLCYFYIKMDFQISNKLVLILLLSALFYGIIVEILQGTVTGTRSADILDVAANLIGSLLGIFFFKQVKNKLKT